MGGGGLRILRHKSWHVWNDNNRQRVAEDKMRQTRSSAQETVEIAVKEAQQQTQALRAKANPVTEKKDETQKQDESPAVRTSVTEYDVDTIFETKSYEENVRIAEAQEHLLRQKFETLETCRRDKIKEVIPHANFGSIAKEVDGFYDKLGRMNMSKSAQDEPLAKSSMSTDPLFVIMEQHRIETLLRNYQDHRARESQGYTSRKISEAKRERDGDGECDGADIGFLKPGVSNDLKKSRENQKKSKISDRTRDGNIIKDKNRDDGHKEERKWKKRENKTRSRSRSSSRDSKRRQIYESRVKPQKSSDKHPISRRETGQVSRYKHSRNGEESFRESPHNGKGRRRNDIQTRTLNSKPNGKNDAKSAANDEYDVIDLT